MLASHPMPEILTVETDRLRLRQWCASGRGP